MALALVQCRLSAVQIEHWPIVLSIAISARCGILLEDNLLPKFHLQRLATVMQLMYHC